MRCSSFQVTVLYEQEQLMLDVDPKLQFGINPSIHKLIQNGFKAVIEDICSNLNVMVFESCA